MVDGDLFTLFQSLMGYSSSRDYFFERTGARFTAMFQSLMGYSSSRDDLFHQASGGNRPFQSLMGYSSSRDKRLYKLSSSF